MSRNLYWRQQSPAVLVQILGLLASCLYLRALKLSWPELFPLAAVYLSAVILWNVCRYHRKTAYFRRMAKIIRNLDEKYLFPEVWKEAGDYEETAYYCLMKECTRSMLEKVEETRREKKEYQEWLETYVHNMKQPISAIRLIAERDRTAENRSILLKLEEMSRMLDQVLYFGRSTSGSTDHLIKKTDVKEVIQDCLAMNKQLLIQNQFRLEIPESIPAVYTDEKSLLFLLNQIIYNAVCYKDKKNAVLRFEYQEENDKLSLMIWDNGCGIAKEDLGRVFEKGYTGRNGRTNRCATGMGLYLCRKIGRSIGIETSIDSREGMYTQLMITLLLCLE